MAKNYEVGNLELNLKSSSTETVQALQDIIAKVKEFSSSIDEATKNVPKIGQEMKKTANDIDKPRKQAQGLGDDIENVGKKAQVSGSKLGKAFNLGAGLYLAKKAISAVDGMVAASADMIQNYRMLQVSSGDYFNEAIQFQDTLNNKLGINQKDSMQMQGYFNTLTRSLGIANKEANLMSETLTKLSYDMGSLFGEDAQTMFTKLQSGLAGQTESIRRYGMDISNKSLQAYASSLGLDVVVQNLSQAEQVMLRYMAIVDQSGIAHGNLAQSIEMPSQQIQVLKQQVAELGMWLSNVFIGTIGQILPYINGFIMAIKEMVKAIAMLFGFNIQNFGVKNFQGGIGGANNLAGAVNNVGKKAKKSGKEIKKMMGLFGWDEIHNVQTPQTPSVGNAPAAVGGIGAGGISSDLMNQLKGYDNLMGNVQMKAMEVRNSLLDWLGFLYDINAETGELTNLRWGGFKEMATSAKLLLGFVTLLVGFKVAKMFIGWGTAFKSFLVKFSGIKVAEGATLSWGAAIKGSTAKLASMAPAAIGVGGAIGLMWSSVKSYSFGKLIGEGNQTEDTMGKLGLSIGAATASGAALGSVIPGVGTAIGAMAGAAIAATASFVGWGFAKPVEGMNNLQGATKETQRAFKPFENSYKNLGKTLNTINWSKQIVSKDDVTRVKGNLDEIAKTLNTNLVEETSAMKEKLQSSDLFAGLNPNDRNKLVTQLDESMVIAQNKTNELNNQILAIYDKASQEKRSITKEEEIQINEIQEQMYENGVKILSKSQEDQDTILRNMTANKKKMNAQQASDTVKEAIKAREGAIKEAETRYAEEMRIAEDLWERGVIDKDQYDELTKNAKTFRDDEIKNEQTYHEDIIKGDKEHSGEYLNHINWETGEVRSNFGILWTGLKDKLGEFGENWKTGWNDIKDNVKDWYNKDIKPWFTLEKWEQLFKDGLSGLKKGWANMLKWFKEKVKFPKITMPSISLPKISLPRFNITGDFGLAPPRVPKIGMTWQSFKHGGFPDGENGMFFANDTEMVGKFTNGKTAVANNNQIVEGITLGVRKGVTDALDNATMNDGDGTINIYLDSRLISKEIKKRDIELEMVRG